jgi:hypothetical protein
VAVVEILSTHEVDERKAQYFAELGLRWIEITASTDLYTGAAPWTAEKTLSPIRIGGEPPWMCETCAWWVNKSEETTSVSLHGQLGWEKVYAFKILDVHFPSGGWIRDAILIKGVEIDGHIEDVWGENHAGQRFVECLSEDGIDGAIAKADEVMARHVSRLMIQHGLLVSKQPWIRTANYAAFWAQTMFPAQYEWNVEMGRWESRAPSPSGGEP